MNTEVKLILEEGSAIGRIKSMVDAIGTAMGKGTKRSSPERRALWQQIAEEATKCRDGIPLGAKPRAPKSAKIVPSQINAALQDGKQ